MHVIEDGMFSIHTRCFVGYNPEGAFLSGIRTCVILAYILPARVIKEQLFSEIHNDVQADQHGAFNVLHAIRARVGVAVGVNIDSRSIGNVLLSQTSGFYPRTHKKNYKKKMHNAATPQEVQTATLDKESRPNSHVMVLPHKRPAYVQLALRRKLELGLVGERGVALPHLPPPRVT